MKTTKLLASIVVIVGVLALSSANNAGNLEPSAAPAPTMKTLDEIEPRIPVQSLPSDADAEHVISEPGSYYFTTNINVPDNNKKGIRIDVNDVTIDLMGYTLKGPGLRSNSGIDIGHSSNVQIRNGTIRDFGSEGVYAAYESYNRAISLFNVRLFSNGSHGAYIGAASSMIKNCSAVGNTSSGMTIRSGSIISGNTVTENGGTGIAALGSCSIIGNFAYFNTSFGINAASFCLVDQNTLYGNGTNLYAGTGCQVGLNMVEP